MLWLYAVKLDRDESSTQSLNRSLAGSNRQLVVEQQRASVSDTLDLARRRRGSNDAVDVPANYA